LKENNKYVFSIAIFFLFYRFRNTHERYESHSLETCNVKIFALGSETETEAESENDKQISESESETTEFGSTTLHGA
jgi:hypothetical protein